MQAEQAAGGGKQFSLFKFFWESKDTEAEEVLKLSNKIVR
jgi:hypothetical protein